MSYIFRQIPGGVDAEQGDILLEAVREVEIEGKPTDVIGVRFKQNNDDSVHPDELTHRVENWRDLPRGERTRLYWSEGTQVRPCARHAYCVCRVNGVSTETRAVARAGFQPTDPGELAV